MMMSLSMRISVWERGGTNVKRMRLSKNLDALILNWKCQYQLRK